MKLHAIIYLEALLKEPAHQWANRLSLSCVDGSSASMNPQAQQVLIRKQCLSEKGDCILVLGNEGLVLYAVGLLGNGVSINADFHGASPTYRRKKGGGKSQMIAKAVGVKGGRHPSVLDATAGLGKDAFVLAGLGCRVTLLERVPVLHALLEDALIRARQFDLSKDSDLPDVLDRMTLIQMDALDYMNERAMEARTEVVYLDPMFPPRKKSAKVKKEMQVLHRLLDVDSDGADALLVSALKFAQNRVVVKRPRIAPDLSGPAPSYILEGKRNRFDVYVL